MKTFTTTAAVLGVLMLAVTTTVAHAELPEFHPWLGSCKENTGGVGEYASKAECETPGSKGSKGGKWERFGVKYTANMEEFLLATVNEKHVAHEISCTGGGGEGVLTGPQTGELAFDLGECVVESKGRGLERVDCETPGSGESIIEFTVSTKLVYVKKGAPKEVGMKLTGKSPSVYVEIECNKPGVMCEHMTVRNSVIGIIGPINIAVEPSKEFELRFAEEKGVQKPTGYEEGGTKQSTFLEMSGAGTDTFAFEQTGLSVYHQVIFKETREIIA